MFQIRSWPSVILHCDGDAFFASVAQVTNPALKGKPVVTGRERGIATSISCEAKKYGVHRGMRISEIKAVCPTCVIANSDYETYDFFSKRMFDIMRKFTPYVEEYSIDEGFADIQGMRRPLRMGYYEIGKAIKHKIEQSLGITVSVGISLTKSLAKIASSSHKPSGLTVIAGPAIETLLGKTPIRDVWGIGENTAAYLTKQGIANALQFASCTEEFITNRLTKPFYEIWKELRGEMVYMLNTKSKTTYRSISKTQTFTPPTNDKNVLWAKLFSHIEAAFEKARTFHYQVRELVLLLKTQGFKYHAVDLKLSEPISYPLLIRNEIQKGFEKIWRKNVLYRTTGCVIKDLQETSSVQQSLFTDNIKREKAEKIYSLLDQKKIDFGSVFFDKQKIREQTKDKPKLGLPILSLSTLN